MTKDEIENLGALARIALTEKEKEAFTSEIDAILEYVGTVQAIAGGGDGLPTPGAVHNILRQDEVRHQPGQFTEVLTDAFPARSGNFLVVKKILSQDE